MVPGSAQGEMCLGHPRDHWDKNAEVNDAKEKNRFSLNEDRTIAWEDSHIMVDLILVNKDTCVFGNEISIQGDVSGGT